MADSKLSALPSGSAVSDTDLFYADQSATSVKITGAQLKTYATTPATANVALFVNPSTGSDSNNGSVGAPFATIAHAVTVAASYDFQNLYYPVITLANGNYTGVQQTLPVLTRCANLDGGIIVGNNVTPTSVTIADGGTGFTFTLAANSRWGMSGFDLTGTYGGIFVNIFSSLNLEGGKITFGGTLPNGGILIAGFLNGFGATLTTTTSSMGPLVFSGGLVNLDNSSIVFANPITFSGPFINGDTTNAFLGFGAAAFTNASNVTIASGTALSLTNGAYFETLGSATVDGSLLTRANFPGHASGIGTNFPSTFDPDGAFSLNSNKMLAWQNNPSGAGVLDTSISRGFPGVLLVGNGTLGDFSGTLGAASLLGTSGTGGVGYVQSFGVGGTVTQTTNKSTGVTLNKPTGQITMNSALLAPSGSVSFTLTNSTILATDTLILNHASGGTFGTYVIQAQCATGSATINVFNIGLFGALSEAIVIGFALIKGAIN